MSLLTERGSLYGTFVYKHAAPLELGQVAASHNNLKAFVQLSDIDPELVVQIPLLVQRGFRRSMG